MVIGGLALGSGYAWSMLRREKRPVSRDLVAFTRREQMQRLKRFLTGTRIHRTDTSQHPSGCA
jgi:hypothetical protein